MSEKKTSRKKVVDKPVDPVETVEQVVKPVEPQTNHTIRDICKAGTAYKSAVADLKYISQRASIERATNEQVDEATDKANNLYQAAKKMHTEYQKQDEY